MLSLGDCKTARVAIPTWVMDERDPMAVYDEIRKCICFLGWPNQYGFRPEGTGFLVGYTEDEFDFGYLVTAGHVVWPQRWRPSSSQHKELYIRVNTKGASPMVIKTEPPEWFFHQDKRIDICAIPTMRSTPETTLPKDQETDIVFINLPSMLGRNVSPLDLGDEVFMPGAFIGRIGERRNIPIIRTANIAAMPEEPISYGSPRRSAFLIETKSLGGSSGSPIFFNMEEIRPIRRVTRRVAPLINQAPDPTGYPRSSHVMPYFLVGMFLGSHSGQYSEDFLSEEDSDIKPPKDADFNAGIGVAMTGEDIFDFIANDPRLKKKRALELEFLRKASGYRPASASRGVSRGNERHREDFTSLLNAAAKKKLRDDQTSPGENDENSDDK